jgi:phage-related baseplate assembly protein
MSNQFTAIDLSQLPAPDIIQQLEYQSLLDGMLDDYTSAMRSYTPGYDRPLPSDPVYQAYTVIAYRLMYHEQRVNDAARAVMPAYATGTDLDHIASFFKVKRLLVDAGDPQASPPRPPTYEDDERLRRRMVLAPEGYTTAGSIGSYVFHALSADGKVKDVDVQSPQPCEILVTLLSTEGNGTPEQSLLDSVDTALDGRYVRPLGDRVTVQPAQVIEYAIEAEVVIFNGPATSSVLNAATQAVAQFRADTHKLGRDITESALHSAIHQPGAHSVQVNQPASLPIVVARHQAGYCTGVNLTAGGMDE